ncbi:MAG: class I SAM-dependent methyltransferase [Candidatus Hydrogenedentes bacterium]|nr:class I SAM-dependent methyltransferase [Candidatus Hydrogenedentota bacterium]
MWLEKVGYTLYWCGPCQFGFVYPAPTGGALSKYYGALASGLSSCCSWEVEPVHKIGLWESMLGRAEKRIGPGPLLDVGCGAGQFIQVAERAGWGPVTGIEISDTAAALAEKASSATIHRGAWSDVSLPANTYAAAALLDVLEHDRDPAALLAYIRNALRPGGCLLITVPNVAGLSLRCFGASAGVVIPPEHLSYFSRRSLARMLAQLGFELVWVSTCDLYLKDWLRYLPRSARGEVPADARVAHREGYLHWYRRLTGPLALAGIRAANVFLGITGLGDQLVCVARKREA